VTSLVALLVLVAGLAATASAATGVRRAAHDEAQARFTASATQSAVAVEDQLTSYFNRLRNVGAFVASGRPATTEELERYVRQDHTFEELRSLQSLVFGRRVEEADLPAFLARSRQAHPDLAIRGYAPHTPGDPWYLITDYVPGTIDFQLVPGSDVTPIPTVRALVDEAARTGRAVIASFQRDPLLIAAASTGYPMVRELLAVDFFMVLPIFDGTGSIGPEHLVGWMAAPIGHFDEALAASSKARPSDMGLALTVDVHSPALAESSAGGAVTEVTARAGDAGAEAGAPFTYGTAFAVLGVDLSLRAWSNAAADDAPATVTLVALGGGLLSLLAAVLVFVRRRDVERKRLLARELAVRAQFQRDIVDSVTSAMVVLDQDGRIVTSNRAWATLLGAEEVDGAPPDERYLDVLGRLGLDDATASPVPPVPPAEQMAAVLAGETSSVEMAVPVRRPGGTTWYAVRATPLRGREGGAVVVHTDITDLKSSHDDLQLRAVHDPLTGLLNRSGLDAAAGASLERARHQPDVVAALFIDLDAFKIVNDSFGHRVGDLVLREVAARIQRETRPIDSVGRLGGDEFVVILGAPADQEVAEAVAGRILDRLAQPVTAAGLSVTVGASIGIAIVDDPAALSYRELVDSADRAMYDAKQRGGTRWVVAS
jgi:diguanylate cyclase (GGDEF)-like protein